MSSSPGSVPDAEGKLRITLTVTAGPHEGRVFTFTGHDMFMVGRSKRAHFQLPSKDRYFSRVHFLVEVNPPQCRLLDTGSRNGTHVNGSKVSVADLKDGDEIKAGRTLLRVAIEGDSSAEVSAPVTLPTPAPQQADATPTSVVEMTTLDLPAPRQPQKSPAKAAPLTGAREPCPACGSVPSSTEPRSTPAHADFERLRVCVTCQASAGRLKQRIPGYWLIRELGRGGMGVVYLALRADDGVRVAVKTIIPAVDVSDKEVARFLREANILRVLDHPHIVNFRDMGESDNLLYFAMDYVPGTDGLILLKKEGPLPIGRAVGLTCQLLEALAYAHAKGFVHRDIKPGNMLVATEGGREFVKLADFGLGRVYQASQMSGLTMTGELSGTVAFMPPEQILNFRESKPPVDQYAAAATLYMLLTGKFVYDLPKEIPKQLAKILQEEAVPIQKRRAEIPEELAKIVDRGLAREPDCRFPDVEAMRVQLRKYC